MKTSLRSLRLAAFLASSLCFATAGQAGETNTLDEHLESFRPFLGKTWRGEFKESKPDKPVVDVSRWERALNGKAIRVLHSVNDGAYGGESLMFWDSEQQKLRYYYFTTAGFHTSGVITVTEKKIIATEKVTGSANGISEVRSTTEIQADGTLSTKAEYLDKDGKKAGGREVVYKEDQKAEVRFK
jgi:hypothetical protein